MNTSEDHKVNNNDPERGFKGVWIPAKIWIREDITWIEKCLIAEIDSLDRGNGCFASNEWLAKRFQTTIGNMANMISELRKEGLIIDRGFDGRTRRLSISQVKAAFTPESMQGSPTGEGRVHPQVKAEAPAIYVRNQVEIAAKVAPPAQETSPSSSNGAVKTPAPMDLMEAIRRFEESEDFPEEPNGEPELPAPKPAEVQKPLKTLRDMLLETLVSLDGSDPAKTTPMAYSRAAKALKEIQSVDPDVRPAEIRRRAGIYPAVMPPKSSLTAIALAANWAKCAQIRSIRPRNIQNI